MFKVIGLLNSHTFKVRLKYFQLILISSILLLTSLKSYGSDSIELNKNEFSKLGFEERANFIHNFPYWDLKDPETKYSVFSSMINISEHEGDIKSVNIIKYYSCWSLDSLGFKKLHSKSVQGVLNGIYKSAKENQFNIDEIIYSFYSKGYYNTRPNTLNYENQYLNILQTHEIMKSIGFQEFKEYNVDAILFSMAKFMFDIEDLDRGFKYLSESENYLHKDDRGGLTLVFVYNHLQEYWSKKGDADKTIHYAQKIIDFLENTPLSESIHPKEWRSFWIGLSHLEIANQSIKVGDLEKAERFAEIGLSKTKAITNLNKGFSTYLIAEFAALQTLTSIKMKLNKTEHLIDYLNRSDTILSNLQAPHHIELSNKILFYQNYSGLMELNENFKASLIYSKKAKALEDSLKVRNDVRKFERINRRLLVEKNVQELDSEKQENRIIQIVLISLSVLFSFTLVYFVIRYTTVRKQERLKVVKLKRAQLNIKSLSGSLTESTIENRNLLEVNKSYLEREFIDDNLIKLKSMSILTPEDWQECKLIFEQVYPGYIEQQKKDFPKITHAELRLLVLEKLGLETNEIAIKLGVNANTIHKTRSRFKKKYQLSVSI